MKRLFSFSVLLLGILIFFQRDVWGQNVNVPTTGSNFMINSGTLYDGGGTGNYSSNNNGYTVISPTIAGSLIRLSGSITIEGGYDYITIYDGEGTNGSIRFGGASHGSGTSCSTFNIPEITSTGKLTVRFYSDGSNVCSGFVLNVSITPPCSGTPTVGTVNITPNSGRAGESYVVSAVGYSTNATGLQYQWQSNTNNTGWVNRGSLSSTYSNFTTVADPVISGDLVVQWRLIVTCTNSNLSATSSPSSFTTLAECLNVGSENTLTLSITPTTTNQIVSSGEGIGPGSRKIYSGFNSCKTYDLYVDTKTSVVNCVSARWGDGTTSIGGWFKINYNSLPPTPLNYTSVTPPPNATHLEIKTGRSSWDATSAVLNYKYSTDNSSTAPTSITGNTSICTGSSTTLTATGMTLGTGAAVKWYTASCGGTLAGTGNTLTVSPTANTTYYARVEGTCNTTACVSTIVTVTASPSAGTLSGNQTICTNGSTTFSSSVTGGSWSSNNTGVATINASTGVITPVTAGNATMTYIVTGTGGCANATQTRSVTVTNAPSAGTLSGNQNICTNASTTFSSTVTGGSWSSDNAGIATINASTGVITPGTVGTATITYTVTGTGGCGTVNATRTITVAPNNTVTAASASPTVCINTAIPNITHTTTGATGIGTATNLPTGVTANWNANTITISGTPTTAGTFNYTIPLTGGCGTVNATGTITVTANKSVTAASASPTVCINTAIPNITHTTTGATGIGTATNLPTGVTANWNANTITISGTPTTAGTFNYTIPLTGGCGTVNATGTITVTANKSVTAASTSPTVCINTAIPNITHTTTGATGIGTATNLPTGVTANWNANTITISGTPTTAGTFNYTIPLTGGCGTVNATGTITINALPATPTIAAVSPTSNFCYGTNITYQTQSGKTNYSWSFPGTSGTDYTLVSGGTSTSNTAVIAWKNKTAGTIISVNYQENGCAASVAGSSSSITLPTKGTNLSVNNESVTCFVNGTNPVHFYIESTGNYVGSINPQGRQGLVTMTSYLSSAPTVQGDCSMPNNPSFHTAYMERKIHVDGSQLSGTGNVNVVLGYTNSELTALQTYAGNGSGGSTPNNLADDITSLINPNLGVTKVSGNGALCAGNVVNYVTVSGGDLTGFTNAKYIDFTVDNFSTFYIHGVNNNSALPITLTSFNASCDEKVNLTWKTATESNVSHFEILKSRDGLNWNLVETVAAVGNSTVENTYAITDVSSLETTYYKLRSVDNDGSSEDFNVVSVNCNVKESWSIHPIPVATKATVTIVAAESMQDQFVISDVNGRVIYTQDIQINDGTTIYDLDLKHLSEGTYFIRLNTGDQFKPMKFIKVND